MAQREIWLDIRILSGGWGISRGTTTYAMPANANAHSIVVHARPTNPRTGEAGDRLFCTNIDLGRLPRVT